MLLVIGIIFSGSIIATCAALAIASKSFRRKFLLHKYENYNYVAIPNKEVVAEFTDAEVASAYAKAFDGVVWSHFPYEEYGFEDPYSFSNTWIMLNENGDIIEYNVTEDNIVVEVVAG